jgi:hypothetical protein
MMTLVKRIRTFNNKFQDHLVVGISSIFKVSYRDHQERHQQDRGIHI